MPTLVARGYANLAALSPRLAALVRDLFADPSPFLTAIAATPATLVHGDWKMGNLGLHPDGRAIVLDWAFPGEGACATDLAWYLGVNCRRMPTTKEAVIAGYRQALEAAGISTDDWWERQLALALLGHTLQQGWSKCLDGRDDEFTWWEERALDAARYLR